MFHFSNAKVNTCCTSSVPCTEAASYCSRSQENTALALTMDAIIMASIFVVIISIIMGLRLTALVILSVIIISIIISSPVPLGLERHRC